MDAQKDTLYRNQNMSWDWDKLKQQQHGRGGAPPQMDDIIDRFKKFKLPGGPLIIVVIIAIFIASTTFYTVKQDEVGIVQLFEGTVLTPKIMGDKVGLSPVAVIFALMVGASLMGVVGMLIAVPAAAVLNVFIGEALAKYKQSELMAPEAKTDE